MGVVALMGGNEFREDCIPLDRELLGMAPHPQRVVVVPTAAASQNPGKAAANGVEYFESFGMTVTASMILNRSDADEPAKIGQLERADVVYLTGGSPAHLLQSLLGSRAIEVITTVFHRGGVIIGSSAGAMVLGQMMRGDHPGTWVPGFSLVPRVVVRPHYSPGSQMDSLSIRQGLDANVSILGIPTATACISDGGSIQRVVGAKPVTVFSSDGISRYSSGESFTLVSE